MQNYEFNKSEYLMMQIIFYISSTMILALLQILTTFSEMNLSQCFGVEKEKKSLLWSVSQNILYRFHKLSSLRMHFHSIAPLLLVEEKPREAEKTSGRKKRFYFLCRAFF